MTPGQPGMKWVPVDADQFESISYSMSTRRLYIKFRNSPTLYFEGVPGFRFQGLIAAPRKDAYFTTYIRNHFLSKEMPPAGA
jgi:hypothetical protein